MDYALHYYDLVLLGVAGAMAGGGLVGTLTAVSLPLAFVAFGALAVAVMVHGLFINGPVDEPADLADEVEADELSVGAGASN